MTDTHTFGSVAVISPEIQALLRHLVEGMLLVEMHRPLYEKLLVKLAIDAGIFKEEYYSDHFDFSALVEEVNK